MGILSKITGRDTKSISAIEDVGEFYDAIDRASLAADLTSERQYVYFTMEVYDQHNGIRGGGGLGVLAADTRRVAEQLNLPFTLVTPFYSVESHQEITGQLKPKDSETQVKPEDFGYEYIEDVEIRFKDSAPAKLGIYQKVVGSTRFLTMSEPGFGALYSGDGSGDHRLYQEVSIGFGGYAALKSVQLKPAVIQLNETATVFAAVARLDELCYNGMNLYEALVYVRKHTLYTNHTLVQAAESEFHRDQFEGFVYPNVRCRAVKTWLKSLFDDKTDKLRLSTLTIELAEAKNCVSKIHARVANYRDIAGEKVKFRAITNGIDMSTWVLPEVLAYYHKSGILDKFNLPAEDYQDGVSFIPVADMRTLKNYGRSVMNRVLSARKDQYGQPIQIKPGERVFEFKRRFVDYKRAWMPFEDLNRLKEILVKYNAHYIMSGRVHSGDEKMSSKLQWILKTVDADTELKRRVHYVQDYDEIVGYALSIGSDASINVPIVGLEACGTSWEKDIANMVILISTADGGVADVMPPACLEVIGKVYPDEVESLYSQMENAMEIIGNDVEFEKIVKMQLSAYLPTISGARMVKDYLDYLFDGKEKDGKES